MEGKPGRFLKCRHENSTKETNMTTQLTTKRADKTLFVILIAVCFGATVAPVHAQKPEVTKANSQYMVSTLPDFGGTSSGGNSINDQSWAAGYSRFPNRDRHATLWRSSLLTDLGTLGGPNSSVTWNVKNTQGMIVGISQTADPEPLGEAWSSAAFYSSPRNVGYINLGFVWQNGQMRGLPPFAGGNNGFATGANNLGQVVGWAENGIHDNACVSPQVLQFRPAMWTLGPDQIHELPLVAGDSSGAATAINDNGQIVGISGICDQAVGRRTAKHAVLWQNGTVTDIYPNAAAPWWNTPTAINQRGDVVGFAGDPEFVEGDVLHAFMWTREDGIRQLKPLPNRTPKHVDSEAYGINERRQVVGVSCDADLVDCRGVIWDHGNTPTDLNDLKGSFPKILTNAKDINNNGEITGRATDPNTGALTAYLGVPLSP